MILMGEGERYGDDSKSYGEAIGETVCNKLMRKKKNDV